MAALATSGRSETAAWVRSKFKTVLKLCLRLAIKRRGGRNGGGTVMSTPPSASLEYRGSSAAPTLRGEAFQFGDNFINDRITGSRRFEAGDRLERVSDRQHLQEEHL